MCFTNNETYIFTHTAHDTRRKLRQRFAARRNRSNTCTYKYSFLQRHRVHYCGTFNLPYLNKSSKCQTWIYTLFKSILRNIVGLRMRFGALLTGLNSPELLSSSKAMSLMSQVCFCFNVICLLYVCVFHVCLVYLFFFGWLRLIKVSMFIYLLSTPTSPVSLPFPYA